MRIILMMMVAVVGLVSGCGDGIDTSKQNKGISVSKPESGPMQTYTLSGSVKNIRPGTLIVLQNNGGDDLKIKAGQKKFSFTNKLHSGATYHVRVINKPGQKCEVKNAVGKVDGADITNVVVECYSALIDTEGRSMFRPALMMKALKLNEGFVGPVESRANDIAGTDPSVECINQIDSKKEWRALNETTMLDNSSGQTFEIIGYEGAPNKTGLAIFILLGQLKKCKQAGNDWRNRSYYPEIVAVIDNGYSDLFALVVNFYAMKIRYTDYLNKNLMIRQSFLTNIESAVQKIHSRQAEEKRQQEEALQQAEAKKLKELKPQPSLETQTLPVIDPQNEKQQQDEAKRAKELEEKKKVEFELEKQFQPLYQRQQNERLR